MSASDKKQQRKAAMVDGMTQRQLREQNEAQAAKQKKTIYTAVGAVCAIAAAALLVWNNMGSFHHNATAATVNGVDYKVADLQYYYGQISSYERRMAQLYTENGMVYPFDYTLSDGEQFYNEAEGITYADYFREAALSNLQQVAALCDAAEKAEYTLSDEGKQTIEEQLAQIDSYRAVSQESRTSYITRLYGEGVTEKVFVRNLTNSVLADEYSQHYKDSIPYAEEDLRSYYAENPDALDSYDYRTFFISSAAPSTTDEDGNTVEATEEEKTAAKEAAKAQAEAAVEEIEGASDREEAFIAAAPKYVGESYKGAYADPDYSLSKGIKGSTLTGNGALIADWLMDSGRKEGDVTYVESASGYYVALFLARYLDESETVDFRHILIQPEIAEGATEPTEEAMEAAKAEAQSLLDQWKAGEATEESFALLANEHSDDGGSNTKGGLYTYVSDGEMVENINNWIFDAARKPGDTELVENRGSYFGWHVVYYVQKQEPVWKGTAIDAKQSSEWNTWMEGLTEATEAVAQDGMKYVGDTNTAVVESEAPAESGEPAESPAQ